METDDDNDNGYNPSFIAESSVNANCDATNSRSSIQILYALCRLILSVSLPDLQYSQLCEIDYRNFYSTPRYLE
jgi:hypothetical protein